MLTKSTMKRLLSITVLAFASIQVHATDWKIASPNGKLALTVSDTSGLTYWIDLDGKPLVVPSQLGFTLMDGSRLGEKSKVGRHVFASASGTWEDKFGTERLVSDKWKQETFTVQDGKTVFEVQVRVFDNGAAIRYSFPKQPDLTTLAIKSEETEFRFADDYRAWTGDPSSCAENTYRSRKISATPYQSVLPALVDTPNAYVNMAESDLTDWAGMFLKPGTKNSLIVDLAGRRDRKGAVQIETPAKSPWRVIMVGRTSNDLLANNLVKTLATPSKVKDTSWIKPGITAWDAWWATTVNTRGTTETHKPYIDLASRMGWPYMLCDWGWNKGDDVTQHVDSVDIPSLIQYAKSKNVKLILWMHSDALTKTGFEKAFSTLASWGVAGVKVDFMNSDSQEMVQWYVKALETAAKYKLLVDFHGAYKPTGLARTYPNYITQEGVLGNEWNKLPGNQCTIQHTMILPFTRALLGPMDYTPGGFNNVLPKDFVQDAGKVPGGNCMVLGSRAHQLALTMIYPSPLLVLCDSPTSYLGKDLNSPEPGLEFYRGLPTVWDETKVLKSEVGKLVVLARRSGKKWYLAAMNGDDRESISISLSFLGRGEYVGHGFADTSLTEQQPKSVRELSISATKSTTLSVNLAEGGGGMVLVLEPKGK